MRWIGVVLAVLALLFTSHWAWAQSIPSPPTGKPSAADEASAKRNFESGLKLYGEGSFAEALIAFEQSYRVGGRPSALKNIAQCHRSLKHFVEAYEAYDQMLTLHEAQMSAADKTSVKQALDELGVLTGTIQVTANESDADVDIDGKNVAKTPMAKPKRVSVGSHTVRVTKPSFAANEQRVDVASQENKKLDVKLEVEKLTGHVVVREQSGRDVHVFVDGADQGPAPWEGDVSATDHTFEAKSARFASEVRKVKVVAKERLDLTLDAAPLTGHLRVTTVPATANISVDGKQGGTGAWEGDLPEGSHRIEVGLSGQTPQVRDVTIIRGQFVAQEIPVVGAIASGNITEYPGVYVRISLAGMIGTGQPDDSGPQYSVSSKGSFVGAATASLRGGYAFDWWGVEGVATFMLEHRNRDYEYQGVDNTRTPPGSFDYQFQDKSTGPGLFLGAGGRVTSKHESFRFTFGLSPGIAIRWFSPRRDQNGSCFPGFSGCGGSSPTPGNNNPGGANRFVNGDQTGTGTTTNPQPQQNNGNSDLGGGAGYTAFALMMDAGILIGSTPGAKFFLGVQAWIDFPPDTIVAGPETSTGLPDSTFARPGRGVTIVDGTQFYFGPTIGLQFGH